MTRLELLKIVVGQARLNGFKFRHWYSVRIGLHWSTPAAAFRVLETQRRYYALLFSHEFASCFWKSGTEITFQVSRQTFQRTMPDGSVMTVSRKPFTRRSARKDVWRYHLREMALAEDPLAYISKYLRVEEQLDAEEPVAVAPASPYKSVAPNAPKHPSTGIKRPVRPLPKDTPAFLKKPYP
jgi:hypothetical protein